MARPRRDSKIRTLDWHTAENEGLLVRSLARGLDILQAYGPRDDSLSNADLALATNLPRPTVSRLTTTLARLGYLARDIETGKYRLGISVLSMACNFLSNFKFPGRTRTLLKEICDREGVHVALSARHRMEMVLLDAFIADIPVASPYEFGERYSFTGSTTGRAYVAALPDNERAALVVQLKSRADRAEDTEGRVAEATSQYRRYGFCVGLGEWRPQVNAVAAAVYGPGGRPSFVITFAGPRQKFSRNTLMQELGPMLVNLVHEIGPISI